MKNTFSLVRISLWSGFIVEEKETLFYIMIDLGSIEITQESDPLSETYRYNQLKYQLF